MSELSRGAGLLPRPENGAALPPRPPETTAIPSADAAYTHCLQLATAHYENFTVGSWLLPRHLRRPLAALYAFARCRQWA